MAVNSLKPTPRSRCKLPNPAFSEPVPKLNYVAAATSWLMRQLHGCHCGKDAAHHECARLSIVPVFLKLRLSLPSSESQLRAFCQQKLTPLARMVSATPKSSRWSERRLGQSIDGVDAHAVPVRAHFLGPSHHPPALVYKPSRTSCRPRLLDTVPVVCTVPL